MSAILYQNLADAGSVTATSWAAPAPPSTLQNPHVSRRWKGTSGDTEAITFDLGSLQSGDTLGLLGLQAVYPDDSQSNMDLTTIRRIRLSATDPTGVAADAYDSGSAAGLIDPAYGAMVELLGAPVSFRYGRIDLSLAGAQALLAGRLVVGARNAFAKNFDYGWTFGYGDLSRKNKSAGGQTFIDREDRYRVLNVTFNAMNASDRYGFVLSADQANGWSTDVLFVIDETSSDITRDSIWGLVTDLSPVTQPNFAQFSRPYAIEERK